MRIPSYDDLTRPIPDITARETVDEIGKFLPRAVPPPGVTPSPIDALTPSSPLYACLRDSRAAVRSAPDPGLRQAQAGASVHTSPHFLIARDFSPRLERHGDSCVVLDVGGLGRLLGTPQTIGGELARAAQASAADVRIAIARSQTAARLLSIAHPGPTIADGDGAAAIAW